MGQKDIKPFYSSKDYTLNLKNGYPLCRCNNCGTIMIDENSDSTEKYELKGTEEKMKVTHEDSMVYGDSLIVFVCPHCNTDEYLTDLSNT